MCFVYPACPIFPVFPVFSQKVAVMLFFFKARGVGMAVGAGEGGVGGSTREGVCAAANRLFVFSEGAGRRKGDLGRRRGLLLLTAPLQARQAISRGDGRNAPAIVFDSDLHTRAAKSQTN